MRFLNKLAALLCFAIVTLLSVSCKSDDNTLKKSVLSPDALLTRTAWQTIQASDESGQNISFENPKASVFIGYTYYKTDGTFTMYNLDDSEKMQGDWSVSDDGKTHTLVAKNPAGEVLSTYEIEIIDLTKKEFSYRITPNASDKSVFFDVIQLPTSHPEPELSPSALMSYTPWETSGATNSLGHSLDVDHFFVDNYAVFAYYKTDGSYTMYKLDNSFKEQGDWSISADGKTRKLVVKNPSGNVLYTHIEDIIVLTKKEFTYRIYLDPQNKNMFVDIHHAPTSHPEPILSPSEILSLTTWITTKAINQKGQRIPLTNDDVVKFVGYSYHKETGVFSMYNFDDSPKMQGYWSISTDGKTRTIIAKNPTGAIENSVVDIITLTEREFIFRTFPNQADKSVYIDIINAPSSHKEPKNL